MAAVAFDSLHYAHQLEAAGMPRAQAEVIAQGLTSMFVHNFDSLVTKDYLDARFSEQSVKMGFLATEFGSRLNSMDTRLDGMDTRLDGIDTRLDSMDARFDSMDTRLDSMDVKFDAKLGLLSAQIDGKLGKLYVMFGVIMAGLAVPIIQTLITWLA